MFCVNSHCHMPLHSLLTDIIDGLGGSTELIKIFNRLGICASADTLARRIQYISSLRERVGAESECSSEALTFISSDNIDFLHSYAQVFCGNQQSSWHGTTVQAVQPIPSICTKLTLESNTTSDSPLGTKRVVTSPTQSTIESAPKVRRRARTRNESHSSDNDQSDRVTTHMLQLHPHITQQSCFSTGKTVTIHDFRMAMCEQEALNCLHNKMNLYFLLKCKNPSDCQLLDVQDYMRLTNPSTVEKSNVVYVSVLDAKADSEDTIMQVLHDTHRRYIEGMKEKWILMEGDAKVYELLQSLKNEYGEELEWVLPYPGDWHLLKNFQRVLMKTYFDAGLKHLAQAAGYPWAAIESCSQFKHTHRFILEVWESLCRVMTEKYLKSSHAPQLTRITAIINTLLQEGEHHRNSQLFTQLDVVARDQQYHSQFVFYLNTMGSSDMDILDTVCTSRCFCICQPLSSHSQWQLELTCG